MSSLLGAIAARFGHLLNKSADSPQTSLCILLLLYKSLLVTLAFCSPDDGFDKSTVLAGWPQGGPLSKLIKWDGIWFTNLAQRGYKYEQDFAFGYGYTNLLSFGQYIWGGDDFYYSIQWEGLFGVFISHLSHLLGTLLLYRLTLIVFRNHERGERVAFLSSCLHVVSPAGIFICGPYTEAPFSLICFGAYFAYASARLDHSEGNYLQRDLEILLTGGLLGVSCTFRSNGLLSGTILLLDAIQDGLDFLKYRGDMIRFRKIAATVAAGLMTGFGQIYPQIIAYRMFCTDVNPFEVKRPWCYEFPPSIYTFVQKKYWDNGFLHYWQTRQIPLFLLATPVLVAMFWSTYWVYTLFRDPPTSHAHEEDRQPLVQSPSPASLERTPGGMSKSFPVHQVDLPLILRFTIPQTIIALVCLFIGHVQIITRLSSGYPVWYWWLAIQHLEHAHEDGPAAKGWRRFVPWFYARWTIMYGVIQTGLYAEMLPPA